MAKREFVENLNTVKQLNSALGKSKELLGNMTGASKNLATQIKSVSDAHNESRKYSQQNLNIAKQQTTVSKNILGVMKAEAAGNKSSILAAKAKLKLSTMFRNTTKDGTKALMDGYKASQKQTKAEKQKQKEIQKQNRALKMQELRAKAIAKATAAAGAAMGALNSIGEIFSRMLSKTFDLFRQFSGKVDEVGTAFGVMGTQELVGPLLEAEIATAGIGVSMSELIEITSTLSDNFGIAVDEAANLSAKIADSGKAMGLNVSESSELFGTLMAVGQLSAQQAEDFSESTYQLARANKVSPKAVMRDIAKSSGLIAKFGASNLDSISKAAIKARRLGLELASIEGASDSLLDFQSSITKQFEAEIILGRSLNLQKARELSLTGDLDGVHEELVKNLGSEAELTKMNRLERQALADAIGMSVPDMMKLVQKTGELETPKSFFDLIGTDAQSSLTTLINRVREFGLVFVQQVGPPLEKAGSALLKFLTDSGFIDKVKGKVEMFGQKVAEIVPKIENFFENIGPNIEIAKQKFSGLISVMETIGSVLSAIGTGMRIVFGTLTLGASEGDFLGLKALGIRSPDPLTEEEKKNSEKTFSNMFENTQSQLNDFMFRPGQPPQRFSSADTIVGVQGKFVDLAPLQNAIDDLRSDMKEYFGGPGGGSVAKAIGTKTADEFAKLT